MKIIVALLAAAMVANVVLPARADRAGPSWVPFADTFRMMAEAAETDAPPV